MERFAILLFTALLILPAAANAADPKSTAISSDGRGLEVQPAPFGSPISSPQHSPQFRGAGGGASQTHIEDDLASGKGGTLSAPEIALMRVLKPMTPPVADSIEGRSIIGPDTRKRVRRTKDFPYRAIAMVTFGGGFQCTGWMISADTLVTSGHCVHQGFGGKFYPVGSYRVFPGVNGAKTPYGRCGARRLYTVEGWAVEGKDSYDYGAIKLDCRIGETVGWFGYFWTRGSLDGDRTIVSGYAGDKPRGTQWKSRGKVTKTQKRRVFYRNDTIGGMSGSPVYGGRTGCGKCVMAVHGYGTYNGPPFSNNNHGTRITRDVFDNFRNWKTAK